MASPIALKCPSCASPLSADDFDSQHGFIKCGYCKALMTLPKAAERKSEGGSAFRERGEVPMPARVRLENTAHGMAILRRWFSPAILFLVFFCIAWDGFLVFWYSMAFAMNGPFIMKIFPIAHVAIGVWLTYFTIASLFNTTRIAAERGELVVKHGPVPWAGAKRLNASEVDQLFCKEKVSRSKNGIRYTYGVWTAMKDGSSAKIIAANLEMDQALFIEQQLEKALGIRDREVPGELTR